MLSENERLCDVVRVVAGRLQRPVGAGDILAHVTATAHQPLLRQAIGQQLFKAARRRRHPKIYRMGLIGNCAYYAPADTLHWRHRFQAYNAQVTLQAEIEAALPEVAATLLHTEHHALAANALAGWLAQVHRLLSYDPNLTVKQVTSLDQLRARASRHATQLFAHREPEDIIDREAARQWLLNEMGRRVPWRVQFTDVHPNLKRYLAILRWPQCVLFPPRKHPVYWLRQMEAFFSARWPVAGDNPNQGNAILACLKFGPETPSKAVLNRL